MPRTVLLRGARQLITLRGEHRPRQGAEMSSLGIIQDGALLIVDGVIREVGPGRRVERLAEARGAEEVDASGKVVLPGFVDCLTQLLNPIHALDAFDERCLRGEEARASIAAATAALNSPAGVKTLSAQRLETDGKRRLNQFLAQGTLSIAAIAGWDGDVRATIKALRVLQELSDGGVRIEPVAALGTTGAADLAGRVRKLQLATLASMDGYAEDAPALAATARKLGFTLRVRGSAGLAAECKARMWSGRRIGPANGNAGVAQGAWAGGADDLSLLQALREADVVCASYPAVDWLLARAPAPLRERVDSGLAVALASGYGVDGSATSNLATVMSLACLQSRLTPAEAITAVTINAAFAMNLAHRVGSLAPGKSADLLLMDTADYREIVMQPGSNLVYRVMLRGQCAPAALIPRLPPASEMRQLAGRDAEARR